MRKINVKIVIGFLAGVVIIGGLIIFFSRNYFISQNNRPNKTALVGVSLPKQVAADIEVIWNKVFLFRENKKEEIKKEGFGPPLFEKDIIETDKKGRAVLSFRDKSELRLDYSTKVALANYEEDGQTSVRVFNLNEGRLWSKVEGALAPQSRWEVRSSNVIASVEGTSFGVEKIGDQIKILVKESRVEVKIIDSKTGEILSGGKIRMEPGQKILIKKDILPTLETPLKAELILKEDWDKDDWLKFNSVQDEKMKKEQEKEIQNSSNPVRNSASNGASQDPATDILSPLIIPSTPETRNNNSLKSLSPVKEPAIKKPLIKEAMPEPISSLKIIKLTIRPASLIDFSKKIIEERTKITWSAFLLLENGEEKEITEKVSWKVLGPIGRFSQNVLTIEITDPQWSEIGETVGGAAGVYIDPTGKKYEAVSPIIKVVPYVPKDIDERG